VRELNSEAFWKLIARLDADPDRAGEKYEALRHKLVIFFEGRSCGYGSDSLADQTLDRVATKLVGELAIYSTSSLAAYCYGVARFVHKEWIAQDRFDPLKSEPRAPEPADSPDRVRMECLDQCLAELPPESRKLILDYYQGERGEKIENRNRLAAFMDISQNALRRRAHWIRARQLEPCLKRCGGMEAR
jgi:DNA-directed RNA polymerase specialized sigma24 family protein